MKQPATEGIRLDKQAGTWNDRILALLAERGPMSMGKIAVELGKNPGGIRQRLVLMESTGRVVRSQGPLGSLWSLPHKAKEKK